MKIAPTLEGGLRIDAESSADWLLLETIVDDAMGRRDRLADRLGKLIGDESVAEDWREFVVPDLDEEFQSAIACVALATEKAREKAIGGSGHLRITRDQAEVWYSVLNQARLALEDLYQFGSSEEIDLETLDPLPRSGFFRSRFYCTVQSLLLDHVM